MRFKRWCLKQLKKCFFVFIIFLLVGTVITSKPKVYADSQKVTVNANILNIRSGPGLSYPIIQKGKAGDRFTLLQTKDDWYEVQLSNEKKGWVASWLVTVNSQSKATSGIVTVNDLNLRTSPELSSSIIQKLQTGQRVQILETNNEWFKITVEGSTGWVSSNYIRLTSKSSVTSNGEMVTILNNGTNLRSEPSIQSSIVEIGNSGETFSVIEKDNDWYKIKLNGGKTAYVASWVVSSTVKMNRTKSNKVNTKGLKGKTIVIDPGHGGRDSGTIGITNTLEKNVTLKTAELLANKLRNAGANVFLTREDDRYVSLPSRVSVSKINHADAFISLHYDSINDQSITGHTSYYYHSMQKILAQNINRGISNETVLKDRGVKFGNFHVIRENTQPAVLLELGYLSNPLQEIAINSQDYQESITKGIYNGLVDYFK